MSIIYTIIIIALGFFFINLNKRGLSNKDVKTLSFLWIYHLGISIYYYFFTRYGGGDAWGYWLRARQMTQANFFNNLLSGRGTPFMDALNYIPANLLRMDFFVNTLFFGLLGFFAFINMYRICIHTIPHNSKFYKIRLFPFLLFLPSIHFWSSGVGKDTLLFLCIIVAAYGMLRISKRFLWVAIVLALSFSLRPHITLMLVASFGLAYILNIKISLPKRIFLLVSLFSIAVLILPAVLEFVKMDKLSINELGRFSEAKAEVLSSGVSFVNISSYPYPFKVFTFIYRPFFFDINGAPALVASFENLLLLLLSIHVVRNQFFGTFKASPLAVQGLLIFFIMGAFVFSMSMSNLGIILRQRNMFLPGLIVFILWSFSFNRGKSNRKNRTWGNPAR